MATHEKLGQLADELEAEGADSLRVQVLRSARAFKRSWVEMAESLVLVRNREAYLKWGYEDFYNYCALELQIKRGTADKLTGSYIALKRHAPSVLKRDGLSDTIPTCDAVDYFARALRSEPPPERAPAKDERDDAMRDLKHAVFEEGAPVSILRQRFNPIFHPKPEHQEALESIRRTTAATRRLEKLISEVDGLSKRRVKEVSDVLDDLKSDLAALTSKIRRQATEAERKAS